MTETQLDPALKGWIQQTQDTLDTLAGMVVKLREDMAKTNEAGLLENQMIGRVNDLVGLQAVQIRDLVRQVETLDRALTAHLAEVGYSE
jgi:hypothetical protein